MKIQKMKEGRALPLYQGKNTCISNSRSDKDGRPFSFDLKHSLLSLFSCKEKPSTGVIWFLLKEGQAAAKLTFCTVKCGFILLMH